MDTMATNDGNNSLNAQNTNPGAQQVNNVIELLPQQHNSEMETQCEGGVCMLTWKPQRPPRTAA